MPQITGFTAPGMPDTNPATTAAATVDLARRAEESADGYREPRPHTSDADVRRTVRRSRKSDEDGLPELACGAGGNQQRLMQPLMGSGTGHVDKKSAAPNGIPSGLRPCGAPAEGTISGMEDGQQFRRRAPVPGQMPGPMPGFAPATPDSTKPKGREPGDAGEHAPTTLASGADGVGGARMKNSGRLAHLHAIASSRHEESLTAHKRDKEPEQSPMSPGLTTWADAQVALQGKGMRNRNVPALFAAFAGEGAATITAAPQKPGVQYVFSSWGERHSVSVLASADHSAAVHLRPSDRVVEAALLRGGGQPNWIVASSGNATEDHQGHRQSADDTGGDEQ